VIALIADDGDDDDSRLLAITPSGTSRPRSRVLIDH